MALPPEEPKKNEADQRMADLLSKDREALGQQRRELRKERSDVSEDLLGRLNALDFVLMFVPIEAALIEALQTDPGLAEFALHNKVALLSPTNFLVTMRTVASVWSVHKQNRNAQEIARRAGLLYD